jgi:serine/threonine protein phosphatase PrpC
MSEDHKPNLPDEKQRIEKAGGFVDDNRVRGVLALSRAIGDLQYKNDKKIALKEQMVIATPEIKI